MKLCVLSGGFDPVHSGHIAMFKAARKKFDVVIVLLNSDAWLRRKKGHAFMDFRERASILKAIKYIDEVMKVDDSDDTVVQGIAAVRAMYPLEWKIVFGNGGDRVLQNTPETEYCEKNGIELVWRLGGTKTQSSSELIQSAVQKYTAKVDQHNQM